MAREFVKAFYHSQAWLRVRDAYIQERIRIDGGMCEVCKNELGYIVHHKVWLTPENFKDERISLNPSNLRYECMNCHNKEKDPAARPRRKYRFDENGNVVEIK